MDTHKIPPFCPHFFLLFKFTIHSVLYFRWKQGWHHRIGCSQVNFHAAVFSCSLFWYHWWVTEKGGSRVGIQMLMEKIKKIAVLNLLLCYSRPPDCTNISRASGDSRRIEIISIETTRISFSLLGHFLRRFYFFRRINQSCKEIKDGQIEKKKILNCDLNSSKWWFHFVFWDNVGSMLSKKTQRNKLPIFVCNRFRWDIGKLKWRNRCEATLIQFWKWEMNFVATFPFTTWRGCVKGPIYKWTTRNKKKSIKKCSTVEIVKLFFLLYLFKLLA